MQARALLGAWLLLGVPALRLRGRPPAAGSNHSPIPDPPSVLPRPELGTSELRGSCRPLRAAAGSGARRLPRGLRAPAPALPKLAFELERGRFEVFAPGHRSETGLDVHPQLHWSALRTYSTRKRDLPDVPLSESFDLRARSRRSTRREPAAKKRGPPLRPLRRALDLRSTIERSGEPLPSPPPNRSRSRLARTRIDPKPSASRSADRRGRPSVAPSRRRACSLSPCATDPPPSGSARAGGRPSKVAAPLPHFMCSADH